MMGIDVDALTKSELHELIASVCERGERMRIFHVNAHGLNLAHSDSKFRQALMLADRVFCDGSGVRLAAWLAGQSIPERITYADWTWEFAEYSVKHRLSWFLLGGQPGRADAAASALLSRFPDLSIAGTHHGFFDRADPSANARVIQAINGSNANVLIVGFGMPIQESWLTENWGQLRANIGLTGGAVFDYVSGELRRPPLLLRAIGMEWLGRLLIEPRRLASRYLVGNPIFLTRAIAEGFRDRLRRSA